MEAIYRDEKEVAASRSGENLRLRVTGAEETDITPGFVLCGLKNPVPCVTQFEAQLMIVELLEHNPVFTVSWMCVCVSRSMEVHTHVCTHARVRAHTHRHTHIHVYGCIVSDSTVMRGHHRTHARVSSRHIQAAQSCEYGCNGVP